MLELIVIRHGESVADIEERHEGRADFPLTERGREQAARLARRVAAELSPDRIWSSPLKRAAEVAEMLSRVTGVPVHYHEGLMEYNNGVLAGMPREEARRRYPLPPGGRPPHVPIEGGESAIEFRARAERLWSEILYSNMEGRLLLVSHGGLIQMLFRAFLQLPMDCQVGLATGDTGLHHWIVEGPARRILLTNSTEHLRLTRYD